MGIRCCCCSELTPQKPEVNTPHKTVAEWEKSDSNPSTHQMGDVTPPPHQIRDVRPPPHQVLPPRQMQQKQLEVPTEEMISPALSLSPSSRQSVCEHDINVELSAQDLYRPQSSTDTFLDVQSSVVMHSSSHVDIMSNESREGSPKANSPFKTLSTMQLVSKLSGGDGDLDEEVDEKTVPVSQLYLTKALSGDWEALEAQRSRSNSIGVNSWDISWLREDFEPDFIETLQLAEEKISTDERLGDKRMQVIKEEESKKTVSNTSTPVSYTPLKGLVDDETKTEDMRKLKVERNIPMTIAEDKVVDPEKAALLNDVLSRSKAPKITNKEMRALKRKLVDAYIEAIPSSRRHLTMISFAVDQIWKDVTDRDSGNLTLLGNQYTKELKWLRSKKDEHTKKEMSRNKILTNVRSKLHSRAGVGYSPNFDDDPKHQRYKTPNIGNYTG